MQACKPGSVTLNTRGLTIYLVPASLPGSIDLPIRLIPHYLPASLLKVACRLLPSGWKQSQAKGSEVFGRATLFPDYTVRDSRTYLVFQPVRFSLPLMSPLMRWALTPPFHPYHNAMRCGGIFSVALSVPRPRAGTFLLGSTVLYVARTFLPDRKGQRGKTACNSYKIKNIDENEKFGWL